MPAQSYYPFKSEFGPIPKVLNDFNVSLIGAAFVPSIPSLFFQNFVFKIADNG